MDNNTEQDDQWLRSALQGGRGPSGLRERIRARLRQEAEALTSPPEDFGSTVETIFETASAANSRPSPLAETRPPDISKKPTQSRRWAGWALALSITALAVGVYQWTRPASTEQLAQFSLAELDRVLDDHTPWLTPSSAQLSELAILEGQLRPGLNAVGFREQPGQPFAESCRVWQLHSVTTNKRFYLFDFKDALPVQRLTRQLQAIRRVSGGWSVEAMYSQGRLVVVLFEGPDDLYLIRPQSA